MDSSSQSAATYIGYKHCCVIDAYGYYSEFVQVHIYSCPGGSTEDRVQHYTLKPGERMIDAMPPSCKPYAGTAGFIRPIWDYATNTWAEGVTVEEATVWEREHSAPNFL